MAGFRVTGDFNRLAALIQRFRATASPQSYRALLDKLALDYLDEVEKRFDTATDPNGVPWAPLADGSGRKPLTKTGALRHSFYADVRGNGQAVVGSRIPYSGFHQTGTKFMPARMMVPASIASAPQAASKPPRAARPARRPRASRARRAAVERSRALPVSGGFDLIAWLRRIGLLFLRRAVRGVLPG